MIYFLLTSILLSITFILLNHPLSLGMILLSQTICIALLTGMMNINYWFSYILFLIMIGGMLILFIYMTSIASNEKFNFSGQIMLIITLGLTIIIFINFLDFMFFTSYENPNDLIMKSFNLNFSVTLNKYLNWPLVNIYILLISYLLITLIMIVKITNIQYGPLRQKF